MAYKFKYIHKYNVGIAREVLWHAFGKDELSPVSLDFLDPEAAEVLAHFQRLVQQLGGLQSAWRTFDKQDKKRVKMNEFLETMSLGSLKMLLCA